MPELAAIIGFLLAAAVAVLLIIYVVVPTFALVAKLIGHIAGFIGAMIRDALRAVSAIITILILSPLIVGSIGLGRWSAAAHFGRAVQHEFSMFGWSVYRVAIGNPAQLLGLSVLTDGIEHRIPEAVGKAPRADKPSRRTGQFDGYTIVGSLTGGGSGARLYIAEPDEKKLAAFRRSGHADIDQVVIKSFSVRDGSSLPQIVRESRSLEAARKLGLVLDHELNESRFYYVMPYIPGEDLSTATSKLHDASGPVGLGPRQLDEACGYIDDLLTTLDRYHRGGLWHKDVKPDNIIVHHGRAQLVDLGLVTPMRSAMTLTTHGTEYFRDPEMVRMALKGVKVHEIEGARFDIYAAGAVLYSIIENSFPAHGGLSHITKRCPDALRLVIRRAMSEYNSRYPSAPAMLGDLRAVMRAPDPYAVKPAALPSMRGASPDAVTAAQESIDHADAATPPAPPAFTPPVEPTPTPAAAPATGQGRDGDRRHPCLRVTDWWSGRYSAQDSPPPTPAAPSGFSAGSSVRRSPRPRPPAGPRRSAAEQLERARSRARAARQRVRQSRHSRRRLYRSTGRYSNRPNSGVAVGLAVFALIFVGFLLFPLGMGLRNRSHAPRISVQVESDMNAPPGVDVPENEAARRIVESIHSTLQSFDGWDWREIRPRLKATIQTIFAEESRLAGKTAAAPAPALAPVAPQGELLVIDDLTAAPAELRTRYFHRLSSNANRAGFALLERTQGDKVEQLEAAARAGVGAIPADPGNAAFRRRVTDWLDTQSGSLMGVVHVGWSQSNGEQKPTFQLVARPNVDSAWLSHKLGAR